ncbi:MAG: hydrogenase maturation nickel metallochaperone HypA [bacterium]
MHEATIAQYAFDIIKETQNNDPAIKDKKVKKITFGMGKPYTVMKDSFEFYFSELIKGTTLDGAELEYEKSELTGFFVSSIDVED